jgi:hypothetical protein
VAGTITYNILKITVLVPIAHRVFNVC